MKYYAVAVGRKPGIYTSWAEASAQVIGFSGAKYKSFTSKVEAEKYLLSFSSNETKEEKIDGLVIYTDGSAINNLAGGAAVCLDKQIVVYGKPPGDQTNNRGELIGIYLALFYFSGNLIIYSDSEYAIGVITGSMQGKKNLDLIELIRNKMKERTVVFHKVLAHAGILGNEIADRYAEKGRAVESGQYCIEQFHL